VRRNPSFTDEAERQATTAWGTARASKLTDVVDTAWQWLRARSQLTSESVARLQCAVQAHAVMSGFNGLSTVHRQALAGDFDRSRWTVLTGHQIAEECRVAVAAAWEANAGLKWYASEREAEVLAADRANRVNTESQMEAFKRNRPPALLKELRTAGVALALGERARGGLAAPRGGPMPSARQAGEIAKHREALVALLTAEAVAAELVPVG